MDTSINCNIMFFINTSWKKYLHVCNQENFLCILNGIEYAIECILMILQTSILLLIKSILKFYKYIKNKKKNTNK